MIADLKPYPAMKDSGVPWLGEVPEHWQVQRLRDSVTACINGIWGSEPNGRDDLPCIRVADFDRLYLRVKLERPTMRAIAPHERRRRLLKKGDLLLEKSGGGDLQPVGVVVLYDYEVPAVCSNFVARMPAASGFDSRYLTYVHAYLYSIRLNVRSIKQTTGIQNLDSSAYLGETIGVPPLPEQAAIVPFLDHADRRIRRYIRAKQKLIKLLEEQKQAIIHRAVTRGLDPNVRLKPSGVEWLGDVPEHWEVWQVGHFAAVGNGSTPSRGDMTYWSGGTYPWLNSGSVNAGTIMASHQFVTDAALRECHLPRVPSGSVLVAITGQGKTRGTAAVLTIEATINQHIAFITPRKREKVGDAGVLAVVLHAAYSELRHMSDDSGSTRGALTCEDLRHFRVVLPPPGEQERIVQWSQDAIAEVKAAFGSRLTVKSPSSASTAPA